MAHRGRIGVGEVMPRLLELFCGTKSIGREFEKLGFEVVSIDIDPQFEPTICSDILAVDPRTLGRFDAVWASPPCNAFTVALIGRNWYHDHTPKNDLARQGLEILTRTVDIIQTVDPMMFWIENPRGKMRRMSIMQQFKRDTVAYCQYGDTRMKPTDIWHNTNWCPRPMCSNGDTCHEAAPRGSKTGTQGIKGSRARAVIPTDLCAEIAAFAAKRLSHPQPIAARVPEQLDLLWHL